MIAYVNNTAFFHGRTERGTKGTFPDFQLQCHITQTDRSIDSLAVGGQIFDIGTHLFKDLANHVRHHDLRGPVVDRNHNRVRAVFGKCRERRESKYTCRQRCCHFFS